MPSINDSKCVLVTGATAGIGRALAHAISDLPSKPRVIATGRRQDRLEELRPKMETIQIDFDTDKETIKKFVDDTIFKYPDVSSCADKLATTLLTRHLWLVARHYRPFCGYPVRDLVREAADYRSRQCVNNAK